MFVLKILLEMSLESFRCLKCLDWSGLAHFCSKMPVWPNALLKKLKLAVIGLEGWDSAQHIRLQI